MSDAAGSLLRKDDPFKTRSPVVIVEQFSVVRVEIKRDHGWARCRLSPRFPSTAEQFNGNRGERMCAGSCGVCRRVGRSLLRRIGHMYRMTWR